MKYYFHPQAEAEFYDAIVYYEECQSHLGFDFAYEVYETIQRILKFPNAWQILDGDIRRCLTNRFPFGVVYYEDNHDIIILAVMQLRREPNYWLKRTEKWF
jgi:hypothetical protein